MRLPLTGTLTLTRSPTPNQVSWEMHEEYASEAETELGCDEDVLEGLFGGEDAEYDPEYDGAAKPSGSPKTKKHWLHGHTPPATKADKEAPSAFARYDSAPPPRLLHGITTSNTRNLEKNVKIRFLVSHTNELLLDF